MYLPTRFVSRGIAAAAMLAALGAAAETDAPPYEHRMNLTYAEVHGIGLLFDVFVPAGEPNGLGVVDVASGAWYSDRGKIRDHERARFYDILCGRGYTVFAVRPGSRTRFTGAEMVDHLKKGIRYVKAHADDYGIDPGRLGIVGASAGGHLALMATVTAEPGNPESQDAENRQDTHIHAAAVFFPPTDFLDWEGKPANFERLGNILALNGVDGMAEEEVHARAEALSPARLVKAPLPPILMIHGDADEVVPLQQSERMLEALSAAGCEAELIVKPGGAHPWPTIHEEVAVLADWLDEKLSPAPAP
jgi:acetyl esterase/lipase